MRAHLLKYSAAPAVLLSVVVFVLAAGASVARAEGALVTRGMERGAPGLTGGGGGGAFSLGLGLVLAAVAVAAVTFAVVNGRRRTVARSSGQITDLPGARRGDKDESDRKAA